MSNANIDISEFYKSDINLVTHQLTYAQHMICKCYNILSADIHAATPDQPGNLLIKLDFALNIVILTAFSEH